MFHIFVEQDLEVRRGCKPGILLHFLFELAALYLTIDDLDAAERTLAAAEERLGPSGFRRGVLRGLRQRLEHAREQESRARATSG